MTEPKQMPDRIYAWPLGNRRPYSRGWSEEPIGADPRVEYMRADLVPQVDGSRSMNMTVHQLRAMHAKREAEEGPVRLVADLLQALVWLTPTADLEPRQQSAVDDAKQRARKWLRGKHDPAQIEMDIVPAKAPTTRNTDPATSHAAPRKLNLNKTRLRVLCILNGSSMDDESLLRKYIDRHGMCAESTPRKRRQELVEMGYVITHGKTVKVNGSRRLVWEITPRGQERLRELGLAPFGPIEPE